MTKVVVVRVGTPNYNWDTKWSSPEMRHSINNQTVRDLYVQQFSIIVIFVGTGDIPLSMATVQSVRARDNLLDFHYPNGNELGLFQSFITFQHKFVIPNPSINILQPILDSIKYVPGQQVVVNDNLTLAAIVLYSIISVNFSMNTTYINPAYAL